ncbi:MAG: hypothetical protein RR945_11420 [Erysipelotrichaceae bacterium]
MIKYVNLKNIFKILKFLYFDTFKGVLSHSIFRNKLSRNIFFLSLITLYLLYFYYNMIYLSGLSRNVGQIDLAEQIVLGKITLSSYFNSIIVLGIFITIFIKSTVRLTNRAAYILKVIPLSKNEIHFIIEIYRASISLFIFEFILIIVAPALKLIPINFITAVLLLISFHIIFLATFLSIEILYQFFLKKSVSRSKNIKKLVIDLVLIFLTLFYYSTIRFRIDSFVGDLPISISNIVVLILIIGLLVLLLLAFVSNGLSLTDNVYLESRFLKVKLLKCDNNLCSISYAILRSKNYIYLLGMSMVIAVLYFIQNTLYDTGQMLLFLVPLISIGAISYSDSTLAFRKMYTFFCIKPFEEFKLIIITTVVLTLPNLIIGFIILNNFDSYFYSISIMLASIILGFLFPKTQSNINETIASFMAMTIVILLSLLANINWIMLPIMIMFMCLLYFILNKEFEVIKWEN